MTDRAAFIAEFKRLTRDGTGNAIVAWRALDQTGAVLDYGMNNAAAIWASSPGGSVIEIEIDGRWMPATSLPPTQETAKPSVGNTGLPQTEERNGTMSISENATPPGQEPERTDLHEAARPDALDIPLTVTFFDDAAAATKREQGLSLSDLAVVFIPTTTAATKAALPWLKLARFGDVRSAKDSLRHNGNVVTITGIEADYDGERVTVNQACDLLRAAKLAAVVYTSPSHTDAAPRWRVLCPLSAETAPDQRAALVGRLNGVLGGVLSRESFTLSQSYYFGSVNSNPAHRVEQIDGDPIDLRDDLPVVGVPAVVPTFRQDGPFDWDRREKPEQPQKPMSEKDIVAALSKDSRGSRSEDAFAFINRVRRDHNYTPREIVDTMMGHDALTVVQHYDDDASVRDDVVRAFTKKDPTDQPSIKAFDGYAAKRGLVAGGPDDGDTTGPAVADSDDTKPDDEPDDGDGSYVEIVCASDIEIEEVRWMWPGWIARHKFQLLAGTPGDGKSTILFDIAATVTRGGTFPDGTRVAVGSVLVWSGEDSYADTVVPRFLAAGGDRNKLHCVSVVRGHDDKGRWKRPFDPATDMPGLIQAAARIRDLALVIVDPVVAMVTGDSHKNAEVRRGLQPLVTLAEERGVAVLGVTHFNKNSSGQSVLDRINGSLAYGALARLAWGTARSLENPHNRVLVRAKSNIGADGDGFAYTLSQRPVPGKPGMVSQAVQWGVAIHGTAEAILARYGAGQKQEDKAKLLLLELLRDGPVPVVDIRKRAGAEGISWRSIERAKEDLKLVLSGNPKTGYTWALPAEVGDHAAPKSDAGRDHATVH